ncbi:hypothetical protein S245_063323 [Arachis hypogaea]|nr:uncharacterized protein DS421_18g620330 [Arachis hypogaea]
MQYIRWYILQIIGGYGLMWSSILGISRAGFFVPKDRSSHKLQATKLEWMWMFASLLGVSSYHCVSIPRIQRAGVSFGGKVGRIRATPGHCEDHTLELEIGSQQHWD